jgi:hypothetical protein
MASVFDPKSTVAHRPMLIAISAKVSCRGVARKGTASLARQHFGAHRRKCATSLACRSTAETTRPPCMERPRRSASLNTDQASVRRARPENIPPNGWICRGRSSDGRNETTAP